MREEGGVLWIRILCVLWFLLELSRISYTGIRDMFPVYVYGNFGRQNVWEEVLKEQIHVFMSIYEPVKTNVIVETRKDKFVIKKLEQEEMITLMEVENSMLGQESVTSQVVVEAEIGQELLLENQLKEDTFLEPVKFVKHERIAPIDLSELEDYETLVKRFYTIDAITGIGPDELNAEKLGKMDLTMRQTPDKPQILIYHTHSQEGYVDSIPGDENTSIMGVGEHLKKILEEEYGYHVIHHKGKYDVETRDSAYSRSLPEIQKLLEDNPSIEVVIDLHRDAVAEDTHLVMDLDGRPTARFMFFNGISRTTKTGKIAYLNNPNLESNLAFSFQAKLRAEEYYPGLTRRNYINAYRYNMHLRPKTMLLELGAQNNTLEEAMNACDPIAHILHIVLSGKF